MKTKIFLLALLANLFTLTVSAYDANIDGIYYNLNGDEAIVTTSNNVTKVYSGDIVIPQKITYKDKTYEVKSIGELAFKHNSNLTSITMPEGIISIGPQAFSGCKNLKSIFIPSSVSIIGDDIFAGCSVLNSIRVGVGNPIFDSRNNCNAIIETATNILIFGCNNTIIPNNVTGIGSYAFSSCSDLTSITLPKGVTSIDSYAFYNCSGLTSITLPNGVTSIGSDAFAFCSGLTSINIPNNVTSIGSDAFAFCSGLTAVHITELAAWCNISFGNRSANPLPIAHHLYLNGEEIKDLIVPNSVTSINNYAFSGCSGLTSITLPNGVTSIGSYAFYNCSGLTSITLPNGVTSILGGAFAGCNGLTSITIPNGVISIENETFSGCSGLTSITIPNSVTSINNYAFSGCNSLTSITIPNSVTSISGSAFNNCSGLVFITINSNNIISQDSSFKNIFGTQVKECILGKDVTSIGAHSFSDCNNLISISIPDGVTSIGSYAFQNCSSLTSIIIPKGITSIGNYAFTGCSNLTSITIPKGVTSIDSNVFKNCRSLTSITIPDGVTSIGSYAFLNCSSLTSITIPNSVTNIDNYAFQGCSGLTSITIPENVTNIGSSAFKNCSSLTSVISNITKPFNIKNDVFQGIDNPCVLYVRKGTKELYTAQTGWNQFADIIDMAQTIIADDKSREYGEPNPSWTYKVIGGKISGVPSITCSATKTSPTGTYDIVVSKGSVTNTDYSYSNGTLTITKAPLKVSVKNCTRYVGDKNPTFELTYSGFKNGETKAVFTKQPTIICNATTNSPVGTYTITVSGGAASNYELSYENGTMTIDALFKDNDFSFLLSGREKEVKLLQAPNTETVIVPENATYNGASYPVTQLADDAFANLGQLKCVTIPTSIQTAGNRLFTGCTRLATIIWNAPLQMTKEMMGNITNPNLLFYTTNTSYAPTSIVNVINSQSKRAERIALADTDGIGDFYCPEEFTASEITYTHTYNQKTERGSCRGWESLALPYDVTEIIHEEKGSITPFGALEKGYELVNGTKPFWLYEYTTRGTFVEAERIEANVPYIISMPYEARLGIEYILKGNVTFKGTNVKVKATSSARAVKSGKYSFAPNYENVEFSTAYLLNVAQRYDGNPEGSVFVKNLRSARPFEAYFEVEGSAGVKPYFGVFEHLTDGIRSIAPAMRDGDTEYYQLDGTKRTSPQRGFNIVRTKNGEVQKALIK